MRIAVVLGSVTSSDKHEAYEGRMLLLVQRVEMNGERLEAPTMAIDYVGAGRGDVVLLAAAPGLAPSVLDYPKAPVTHLICGIVDRVELADGDLDVEAIRERYAAAR